MQYKCPICTLWPFSHSLIKMAEKNGILHYYTCPAQGILNHYDGVLN